MIARFFLVLPFNIFIPESGEWPMLEIASDAYRARIHFPSVVAERPDATASVIGTVTVKLSTAVFGDNLLVNGKKVARTNVLTVDLLRPEFDRSTNSGPVRDPDPELAFEIANQILDRIRAYSRVFESSPC